MNVWAVSALPVHSSDRAARRKAEKTLRSGGYTNAPESQSASSSRRSTSDPGLPSAELLEPAIDGPPSPESLRAVNKLMRKSSKQGNRRSHQTSSSASSSLRSLTSPDRPSWEQALDGLSLSRKSSGKSITGNMQLRDRSDSVQMFGKSIFSIRGKARREGSAPSSSGSSGFDEASLPPASALSRESGVAGIFGRRRATKPEADEESNWRRRFQISAPYNFQHVVHSRREDGPDQQRASHLGRMSEYSQKHAQDLHFPNFSTEALAQEESGSVVREDLRESFYPDQCQALPTQMQTSPRRRLIKRSVSQDQLRMPPPPRPLRSSINFDSQTPRPVPPPRVSSRASVRHDNVDSLVRTELEKPNNSGGFRQARPFCFSPDATTSPFASLLHPSGSELGDVREEDFMDDDDPATDPEWPLSCTTSMTYEAPLPGVPEEEESVLPICQPRASIVSNCPSLRLTQSVPLLRRLSPSADQDSDRPTSGTSDTLGHFDLFAAQRELKAASMEVDLCDFTPRDTWEDDIDYCYNHEADADFNFAWERPSLDTRRVSEETTTAVLDRGRHQGRGDHSPALLIPGQFDLPALSPASQVSISHGHEAITPTAGHMLRPSNFSLPRAEHSFAKRSSHLRASSDTPSYRDQRGSIVYADYRLRTQALKSEGQMDMNPGHRGSFEGPLLTMNTSVLLIGPRTSASTTGSNESHHSTMSERHTSTTSATTDLTRLTTSTASLSELELYVPHKSNELEAASFSATSHVRAKSQTAMPSLPEWDESTLPPVLHSEHSKGHLIRSSESNLTRVASADDVGGRGRGTRCTPPLHTRRRARTSLSSPPPAGQYALFPTVHITGERI